MAKLAQKKKATNGAKSSTASKSKKAAKAVEISDEEESFDDDDENEEENATGDGKETKSTLLDECKLNFNTQDLYEVLNLEKKTATQSGSINYT
jgi:hypothetical protein